MYETKYLLRVLFLLFSVTLIHLYVKPGASTENGAVYWLDKTIHPIHKSLCPLQGFECPTSRPCDCREFCSNDRELESFQVMSENEHVYVGNKRLMPGGAYCLPKGVGACNLKTHSHVFSLAGWSCLPTNRVVFRGDKHYACQNDEAADNDLNYLWDKSLKKRAGVEVDDYYEPLGADSLRYECRCESKSIDGTPMISVFPFTCSVDYCLRDVPDPLPGMGWNGRSCDCQTYPHLDPGDAQSPCRRALSKAEEGRLFGRVDCMTERSFTKSALYCPTSDDDVFFQEHILQRDSADPAEFIDMLVMKRFI